jgi:hypothetical protein
MDGIQDMKQPILETLVQQPIRLVNHKKPQMLQCEIWSRLDMINQTTWGRNQDVHSGMASQDTWGGGAGMGLANEDGLFVGERVLARRGGNLEICTLDKCLKGFFHLDAKVACGEDDQCSKTRYHPLRQNLSPIYSIMKFAVSLQKKQ